MNGSVGGLGSVLVRIGRFVRSDGFRQSPVQSVARRLRWRLHWRLRPGRPFEVVVANMSIRLAPTSASSGIYLGDGSSDASVAQPFQEYLRSGMVAFDCGAHIGEYTLMFARLVGAEGEVHAFEPDPRLAPYLDLNVRRNGLTNVRVNNLALSDRSDREAFAMQPDGTTSSLVRCGSGVGNTTVDVATTTLDEYMKENAVARVDAIKIDVEGAEALVLAGARAMLGELRPALVFVECHNPSVEVDVRLALEAAGYRIDTPDRERLHGHLVARPTRLSA